MASGIVLSIGSFLRYFVIYQDMDRLLIYVIVGLILSGFGFLYEKYKHLHDKYDALSDQVYLIINPEEVTTEDILGELSKIKKPEVLLPRDF